MRKRTIIIGDTHGMLDELIRLVQKVNFNEINDRLILCGDLVDRGPDSIGVIEHAMQIGAEVIIGNHDFKYIRYRRHERKKTHVGRKTYQNPIKLPPDKLAIWNALTDDHLDYLENGSYCLSLWEYNTIVVHAGVTPGPEPHNQYYKNYMYTRYIHKDTYKLMNLPADFSQPADSVHWSKVYDAPYDIIYGHDVQSFTDPVIQKNSAGGRAISIDTGACFGGKLTAAILNPNDIGNIEFQQVQAKKAWREFKLVKPL